MTATTRRRPSPVKLAEARLARAIFAVCEPGLDAAGLAEAIADVERARRAHDALCVETTAEVVL